MNINEVIAKLSPRNRQNLANSVNVILEDDSIPLQACAVRDRIVFYDLGNKKRIQPVYDENGVASWGET